jgi:hypothetical protein
MTNTIPWGKQGAAFEPGGPIPMLTCRLNKPQIVVVGLFWTAPIVNL